MLGTLHIVGIGELARITPGPYIHIGGDEASSTAEADYVAFVERVQPLVRAKLVAAASSDAMPIRAN